MFIVDHLASGAIDSQDTAKVSELAWRMTVPRCSSGR